MKTIVFLLLGTLPFLATSQDDTLYTDKLRYDRNDSIHVHFIARNGSAGIKTSNGGGCGPKVIYYIERQTDTGWVDTGYGPKFCMELPIEYYYTSESPIAISPHLIPGTYRIKLIRNIAPVENTEQYNNQPLFNEGKDEYFYTNAFVVR